MRDLKRIVENLPSLKYIINNNAPIAESGNLYDIRVEHYSRDNENKVLFEASCPLYNENGLLEDYIPFRVIIGNNLIPKIKFRSLANHERHLVRKYRIREILEDTFYMWVYTDYELLEVLAKML